MIFLEQNFINPVVLYLPTNNPDIEGHIFMFEKSEIDFVMFYIGINLSNYISSYHLFEMPLYEDVSITNFVNDGNKFNLMQGQYKYSIFETTTLPNDFEETKELLKDTKITKKISAGLLIVNTNENTIENPNVIIPDIFK